MEQVSFLYWKLAALCFVIAITFFFFTAEALIRGKLSLPSWVFSAFTFVIGFYFFTIFLRSIGELRMGSHDALDELLDVVDTFLGIIGLGHLM